MSLDPRKELFDPREDRQGNYHFDRDFRAAAKTSRSVDASVAALAQ